MAVRIATTLTAIIISTSVKPRVRPAVHGPDLYMTLPLLAPGLTADVDAAALADADQRARGAADDLDLVLIVADTADDGRRLHDADVGRHGRRRDLDLR